MPKPNKETNTEFQKREFPARIKAAKKQASAALKADKAVGKGYKRLTVEERGKHQTVLKAVGRLEKRMGIGPQKKGSAQSVSQPGGRRTPTGKSTPKSRRRPIEKATGTSKLIDPLRKLGELAKRAGKK